MLKPNIKSFVYSFSISLLAIVAVNRFFWYEDISVNNGLGVKEKSVVLFLSDVSTVGSPYKKISLVKLPGFGEDVQASSDVDAGVEITLADSFDDVFVPLEVSGLRDDRKERGEEGDVVLSEVFYSPHMSFEESKIDADLVYAPDGVSAQLVLDDGSGVKRLRATSENSGVGVGKVVDLGGFPSVPVQVVNGRSSKDVKVGSSRNLGHVALNSDFVAIQSVKDRVSDEEKVEKNKEWASLAGDAWVVARGAGTKNQMAIKAFPEKADEDISGVLSAIDERKGVQVATETVKNLIIPIPEEIMSENDLTPKLVSPSSSDDVLKEKKVDAKIRSQSSEKRSLVSAVDEDVEGVFDPKDGKKVLESERVEDVGGSKGVDEKVDEKKVGIIGAINSIFSSSKKKIYDAKERAIAKAHTKKISRKQLGRSRLASIMPTEIRLSFQPGRAEISGQTLRWVQAFAVKAAETPDCGLEIRIDGMAADGLQQRRLNLLYNILTHKGVDYSKINTVFTSREPNSFILRTVKGFNGDGVEGNGRGGQSRYIQW